ncbi:MAG: TolC family protein [Lentisphaerae bacterium]|nr:TolC family protein [Lentisphaerota bacterium]MBT4820788.1 TolC family protein [Lentisphaerota bacterium]MBT5605919.1 TolC family protein [Lentisphaerota bacterium]MBT7057998.1 TolC family protein [Lentisphaerota bacterium]MBT7848553.1 TolC family protein [Lentisphaerota bacterium]
MESLKQSVWCPALVLCAALWAFIPMSASGELEEAESIRALPNPLGLTAAKRIAVRDNPGLLAVARRIDAAVAAVDLARTAYYPTARLNSGVSRTENLATGGSGVGGTAPFETYEIGATASWLLFDGAGRRFRLLGAQVGVDIEERGHEDAQRLLLQGVATAYYGALLAQEGSRIARQDADFNSKLSEETQKRFAAGAAAKSEVLNFRIRTKQAESDYVRAEYSYRSARTILAAFLGVNEAALPVDFALEAVDPGALPADPPELASELSYALSHRPDLLVLQGRLRRLAAELKAIRSEYFPQLSFSAGTGLSRVDSPQFNWDEDLTVGIGVNATWDVFTGGSTRHKSRVLKAQIAEVSDAIGQRTIEVASELRQQLDAVGVAKAQVDLLGAIFDMSSEVRDLVRSEYLAGRTSLTRLNEAQTDLVRASGGLATARIRLFLASEDLGAASGRILGSVPSEQ